MYILAKLPKLPKLPKLRKLLCTCAVFAATILCSLILVEAMLRAKNASMQNYDIEMWKYSKYLKQVSDNRILGHEHVPNAEAVLQAVKIRTNALGLRGPEVGTSSQTKRILFLGSSITLGWGVQEAEAVSEQLRELFKKEGKSVEVLNAGIGNYNAERYIERFFAKLQQLQPTDIVIHGFVRDAEPLEFKEGNFFLKHSQLAVTLWSAYNRLTQAQGENALISHYQKCYDPNSESFMRMKEAYRKLSLYAKQHGIKVYFAMTPDIHNLKNYPLHFAHDAMKAIALENGFTYIDLMSTFQGLDAREIWAMPGDPHPNAFGHRLMAEAIYTLFKK